MVVVVWYCWAFIFICVFLFFFFNDTATTEIYTLSLHDALPISDRRAKRGCIAGGQGAVHAGLRSEEHTSELQSHHDIVCRLLLEKKKKNTNKSVTEVLKQTKQNGIQHDTSY